MQGEWAVVEVVTSLGRSPRHDHGHGESDCRFPRRLYTLSGIEANRPGDLRFACLIAGHYEAEMGGNLVVR